ncbi:MAG TPA: type II secretion system protein N [Woeseiaceae bacterium]|nr:type II secretion system protein N [Woeseiaceae bacterium]
MLPSRVACRWFLPDEVQASGISGSVWHGRIAEGVAGGLYFRDLSWHLRPLSLFTGKLLFAAELAPPGGFAEADVGLTLDGSVLVNDLRASVPLAALGRMLQLNGATGDLSLQLETAELVAGWPSVLNGTIGVANLRIPSFASLPLGAYRGEFQTTDDAIVGSVEDTGGVLDVAGTLRLAQDRTYSFIGQVGATAAAPASVTQQLRFLGTPDARGLREFRFEGAL